MKKPVASINSPGQLTVLAALLAGLCAPAFAVDSGAKVVISQVYGAGGNAGASYRNDFIELFNRSNEEVSLGGMSVQYAATKGVSWARTNLNSVILQPGQYYLVGEASQATVGSTTPTPDQIGTIAMAGGAGKAALVSNTTLLTGANPTGATVLDLVGYGTGTDGFEGSGPTGTLGATVSASRLAAGCTDENNNAADFITGAVAPRNSGTIAACGVVTPPANKPIVASCPAFSVAQGIGGSGGLSATDEDSIVTGASITSGALSGITLGTFTAAGSDGQAGSVNLSVAANVAPGTYALGITFVNNEDQSAVCSASVTVQPNAPATLKIMDLQGHGAPSAYNNTVRTVDGVITFKFPGTGYFIQDQNGDGDPTTSDGILVFGTTTSAAVGDLVRVTGTVFEYKPASQSVSYTEIKDATSVVRLGAGTAITPTNVSMPMDLSSVQGMLVRFPQSLVINSVASLGTNGQITLASVRRETPTNRYRPNTPEAIALAAANAIDQIVLDDGIFVQPNPIPFIGADNTVRAGDTVENVVGVVDFGSIGNQDNAYKLQVPSVAGVEIVRRNPRTGPPAVATGNVRVASANVLNFFTTFTNGATIFGATGQSCYPTASTSTSTSNCRGADNLAEFNRQRDKIVNELVTLDADVVGLMEIQNNENVAVHYLVDQMNAKTGFTTYASVALPPARGTDAIRVAMIYKPNVVTPVGLPMSDGDSVNNRAPLAQTFKANNNGGKFSVIVNHLKSKGSCGTGANADLGDGQACHNATRVAQAQRLATYFIPQVKTVSGDDDVLVIGDMNAHGFEDPIHVLTSTGMVNELERFGRPNGIVYSYNFDSLSAYLDHALASPSLDAQVVGATEWHNNSDEPEIIDYNLNDKPQDLYANNAYRASDHDPVLVSLNLLGTFADVTASFSQYRSGMAWNRTNNQFTGTLALTNTTAAAVTGPFNVEFAGLPAGVTLLNATGMRNGVPYITVNTASVAAGAKLTVSTVFSNPSKGAIPYTATISSGSF
ncbi:ExeM/NucH family extracellular endonuclease [Massilia sp. TWR1-2-2]|uniref:ExeM/NucH family extracellular endonuclease n=1 Tax=Massilia sp. TWR1-2-2 TaxID=2804584 RepID=UPI003CF22EA6